MNYTRPNIAYVMSRFSGYTHNPARYHWDTLRYLLRYLKGTKNYYLHFNKFPSILEWYNEELFGHEVPYLSAISALMYLANNTRPNIAFLVNLLARYSSSPTKRHWNEVKKYFVIF